MRRSLRMLVTTAFTVAASLTTALTGAGAAHADDTPTDRQLLDLCANGTDYCAFHPSGGPTLFSGSSHQVGNTVFNCGPGDASGSVEWSDTTGESNSVGISFIQTSEGPVGVFKEEFEVTYGHRWGTNDTTSQKTTLTLRAGQKGWISRVTPMQQISGTYELHFGYQYYGHYYWYVPFTITGPASGIGDTPATHSQNMTAAERAQICR